MIWRKIFFLLSIVSSMSFAQVIDIENLNLDLQQGQGSFSVDKLVFDNNDFNADFIDLNADLNSENGSTLISATGMSFKVKGTDISGSDLFLNNAQVQSDFNRFYINCPSCEVNSNLVQLLNISCESNEPAPKPYKDRLLNQCMERSDIRAKSMKLSSSETSKAVVETFVEVIERTVPSVFRDRVRSRAMTDELEDIRLSIRNGKFRSEIKFKFVFRLKAKMSGTIVDDKDNGQLILTLEKAKVGFISVKSRVLKIVRDAKIKSIQVSGDRVFWKY